MHTIMSFYRGYDADFAGRMISDYIGMDYDEMENSHDWVQWAFPLTEYSRFQPDIPVLSEFELKVFRHDNKLQRLHHILMSGYIIFLTETDHWREKNNHNHMRISRMLCSANLIGNRLHALSTLKWLTGEAIEGNLDISDESYKFWLKAVNMEV